MEGGGGEGGVGKERIRPKNLPFEGYGYFLEQHNITLCSSRKYPYPPHGRSLEIPRGWGVSKAKMFEGKYGALLEFPEGWGDSNQKAFRGRGMDILWNNTLTYSTVHIIYLGL